jgi:hypothetical protein
VLSTLGFDPARQWRQWSYVSAVESARRARILPIQMSAASRKRDSGRSISVRSPRWARSSSWSARRAAVRLLPQRSTLRVTPSSPRNRQRATHCPRLGAMLISPCSPRGSGGRAMEASGRVSAGFPVGWIFREASQVRRQNSDLHKLYAARESNPQPAD